MMLVVKTQKEKIKGKRKPCVERKKKKGNYNTYHVPLSKEWIKRRL